MFQLFRNGDTGNGQQVSSVPAAGHVIGAMAFAILLFALTVCVSPDVTISCGTAAQQETASSQSNEQACLFQDQDFRVLQSANIPAVPSIVTLIAAGRAGTGSPFQFPVAQRLQNSPRAFHIDWACFRVRTRFLSASAGPSLLYLTNRNLRV